MFKDEVKIKLIAGKGGDGCVSFRREKFVPKGGPDGGDGGEGGDIILRVNPHLNTLGHLINGKHYKAEKGVNGKGKNMHGKNAEPFIIEVPQGTMIFNEEKNLMLADLDQENQEIVIAKGGQGGMGNARFVTSTHQAPRFAENGEPGEEITIYLELKLVADVGIIGLPSAGKSTFISVISNAKPKIAAYHFTTLVPNLGVVNMSKFGGDKNLSFVVADIPGLIEGASEGKGLGHQFLKHIARTKLLVHILDGSLENTSEDYKTIIQELKNFSPDLIHKEQIVVLNKTDLLSKEEIKEKAKALKKVSKKKEIYQISNATNSGIKELLYEIIKLLEKVNKLEQEEKTKKRSEQPTIPVFKPHLEDSKFIIEKIIRKKTRTIFRVQGKDIEKLAIMTDIKNQEGLERLYRKMDEMGLQRELNKSGAKLGDVIRVNDKDIPYRS